MSPSAAPPGAPPAAPRVPAPRPGRPPRGRPRSGGGPLGRLRRRAARRAGGVRNGLFAAVIGATVLLVAVAGVAITSRWRDQGRAMRRALERELASAAVTLLDASLHQQETSERVLVAPLQGMLVKPGRPRMALDDFSRYAAEHLRGMEFDGDARFGTFRVDLRAPWPTQASFEADGGLRDPALRAAVLAQLARRGAAIRTPSNEAASAKIHVGGQPVNLAYARERDADGRPLAVFGVTYSAAHWHARLARRAVERMPLLPPSFYGVDWTTAAARAAFGKTDVRHNALLAVRLADPDGAVLYRSPAAASSPDAPPSYGAGIRQHGFDVRVGIAPAHAERLVAAAGPLGAEQWLLGGVAVLGALFVAAAVLELRRQHQLAEERRNFVSAISHELRTPLAHMVLMSETLLGPAAQTAEQRRRWLSVIHRESVRLGRLVENVLLHVRGEQHDLPLDLQPVDAGEVAREAAAGVGAAAAARRARVHVVAPPAGAARADAGALRQVLLNLLDNAVKYGPDGQTVTVTVAAPSAAAPALVLTVDDEGPGIPPADRRRVWAPFVRLGGRGGATGGSGLGLSVVRDLVRRHGGRAEVGDAPGGGARFVVTLPQEPPAVA